MNRQSSPSIRPRRTPGQEFNAGARVAWALTKLTGAGERPVRRDHLVEVVGLPIDDAPGLVRPFYRTVTHDGLIEIDRSAVGPPRYRVELDGHPHPSSGGGCAPDMFQLTLATGKPVHAESVCPVTGFFAEIAELEGATAPSVHAARRGWLTSLSRC